MKKQNLLTTVSMLLLALSSLGAAENKLKTVNKKLVESKAAADQGDYETAIADLNEAKEIDSTRDLIWFKLGDYYRLSADKQTDPAERQKRLASAIEAYQKAVQLKRSATNDKDRNAAKNLAAYYNNLAEAYANFGKVDDAVRNYELAAQSDPTNAGQYYFNTGAILTNAGKFNDALAAFNKVITADPANADAYYWEGVAMFNKSPPQGYKKAALPGTAEAFEKYLALRPTGRYADAANQMLSEVRQEPLPLLHAKNDETGRVTQGPRAPLYAKNGEGGRIKGTLTFYFNNNFGNRPDVGSMIALVQGNIQVSENDFVMVLVAGTEALVTIGKQHYRPFRATVADGDGNFEMIDLPSGEYTLVIVSNHTKGGQVHANLRDAGGRVQVGTVTVRSGETTDVSHDFGASSY